MKHGRTYANQKDGAKEVAGALFKEKTKDANKI